METKHEIWTICQTSNVKILQYFIIFELYTEIVILNNNNNNIIVNIFELGSHNLEIWIQFFIFSINTFHFHFQSDYSVH